MSNDNPSAALLVPLAAEALIMNNYVRKQWTQILWRRFTPNWQGFASSMAPPYGSNINFTELTAADDGVYLHWALPAALTRATVPKTSTASASSVSFPCAPNRWMVVRLGPIANGTRALRAWIIQSDYLTSSSSAGAKGTSAFVHPFLSQAGALKAAQLGTHIDITSYTGDLRSDSDGKPAFLVASGPGDVSFAAYQPGANDVFAFFDQEITTEPIGSYDYLVAGWHAGASTDPLSAGGDWTTLLQSLNWMVMPGPNAPGQSTPASASYTVYHSAISGVAWQGISTPSGPQAGVPSPKTLSVYVGSTTLDALCTAIQQKAGTSGPEYVLHLKAFMMGMLPQLATPGGALQVLEAIERARFASTTGGTTFAAAQVQPSSDNLPPLTPAEQSALDALNAAQAQYDALLRQLQSLQWELYATWWKSLKIQQFGPGFTPEHMSDDQYQQVVDYLTEQLTTDQGTVFSQVTALQLQIQPLVTQLPALNATPAQLYTYAQSTLKFNPALTIKAVPNPRFYQPMDPVVLVAGLPPSMKYANENTNPKNGLPCRFNTQIIGGINYQNTLSITPSSVGTALQVPANAKLPATILPILQALTQELFFLDSDNATLIASKVSGVTAATLQTQMKAQQNMLGTPPTPIASNVWSQPFSPLYLEWSIQYAATPLAQMSGWSFNGDDYTFTGTLQNPTGETYSGRSVITPHAADLFTQQLQSYINTVGAAADPDLQQVLNILKQLNTPDMLSQAVSGLHNMMLLRDPGPTYPPAPSYASQIGYEFHTAPYTDLVASQDMRGDPRLVFPVRAGFFRFVDLRIIDAFGQTLDLLAANGNPVPTGQTGEDDYFAPFASPELVLDSSTTVGPLLNAVNWMRMPPRVVQTGRLDMSVLAVNNIAHGTPVHGWLVPNHLDRAISVYDANGNALGEIMAVLDAATGASSTAIWVPAPVPQGSTFVPPATPGAITDTVLQSIVTWLVKNSSDGVLMQSFMDVVDETLWTMNPLGGRADPNLSVLMGQPLAVVQVKLNLELEQDPAEDQSFTETWRVSQGQTPNTEDLLTNPFSIQLGDLQRGDDGVIGYFTSAFDVFNSTMDPRAVDPTAGSNFIRVIGQNGNWLNLTYAPGSTVTVTTLVDPRGNIHARTGALPVTTVGIPAQFTEPALAALSISFRTGPLLSDPSVVRIPKPAEQSGVWAWLGYPPAANTQTLLTTNIVPADGTARLGDRPGVNEGWLQFTPESSS